MPRIKTEDLGPNPVDIYIGAKLKSRRLLLGFSQEDLANAIGLTFQQVQKYERGTNRISASRLVDICRVLKAPIDYFFEGSFAVGKAASKNMALKGFSDNRQEALEGAPLTQKDVLELVRAYTSIKNPKLKKQILEMAKAMSNDVKTA